MMSGSTVLKNSAQLCSQTHKKKHNDKKDDQQKLRKGNEENMSQYSCFYSALLKPVRIPVVAVSPV